MKSHPLIFSKHESQTTQLQELIQVARATGIQTVAKGSRLLDLSISCPARARWALARLRHSMGWAWIEEMKPKFFFSARALPELFK
jgi:hypothetical protein